MICGRENCNRHQRHRLHSANTTRTWWTYIYGSSDDTTSSRADRIVCQTPHLAAVHKFASQEVSDSLSLSLTTIYAVCCRSTVHTPHACALRHVQRQQSYSFSTWLPPNFSSTRRLSWNLNHTLPSISFITQQLYGTLHTQCYVGIHGMSSAASNSSLMHGTKFLLGTRRIPSTIKENSIWRHSRIARSPDSFRGSEAMQVRDDGTAAHIIANISRLNSRTQHIRVHHNHTYTNYLLTYWR